MSAKRKPPNDSPSLPVPRWRLWVDGCGGFLLIGGDCWTVGGFSPNAPADICVRADWPRLAGKIVRQSADYFWHPYKQHAGQQHADQQHADRQRDGVLVQSGTPLPIGGSAQMTLTCPSPLSNSATLFLRGPHRFDGHVDGVILIDQVLQLGPSNDCHIRMAEIDEQIILLNRDGRWQAKRKSQDGFHVLPPGQRVTVGTLEMTLEPA